MTVSQPSSLEKKIAEKLAEHPLVRLAILFGSFSDGREGADSDLDLAIAGEKPVRAMEKKNLIEELALLSGRPVDLVDLQASGQPITGQVLAKGRLVYCTDRNLYAGLIRRSLFDHADWMPYKKRILEDRRRRWIES